MTKEKDSKHTQLAHQVGGAIAGLLALALLLGLTACGGGQAKAPEDQPPSAAADPLSGAAEDEPAPPEEPDPIPEGLEPVDPSPLEEDHDGFPEPEEVPDPQPTTLTFTQEEFDALVSDVLDSIIQDGMTPLEQAKAVFTYVHNNISYTGHADKSDWMNGAYVGLTTMKGDCFTYYAVSRALLDALEIDNLPVERVGGKTLHFWNLVNCGDGWYHFDACPRSIKMPSFNSFMVTDEQIAAFTAMAGRNYYDFDGSLLPERATEIVTKTWPKPRPVESEEPEAEDPNAENPGAEDPSAAGGNADPAGPAEPALPDEPVLPPDDGVPGQPEDPNAPANAGDEPPAEVWTEPPAEEQAQPGLDGGGAPEDAGILDAGEGTEAA